MEPVIYPPTIDTDKDKLFAVYSLVQQMIAEYNRQSAIAASDSQRYADKFRSYAKEQFEPRLQQLLAERNRLIEAIRWANYTPKQWEDASKLSTDQLRAIYLSLFGDKGLESAKPTLATSPILDELKLIDIDKLSAMEGVDPTENFTTYTEYDEGSTLTKDANTITFTNNNTRQHTSYIYKDKTANHFYGNFEHRVKWLASSMGNYANVRFHMVSNTPDKDNYQHRIVPYNFLGAAFDRYAAGPTYDVYAEEQDGASFYYDPYYNYSLSTTYYSTIKRDEDVGTYGTLYHYLCTGNYYGEAGSSLVDTMSIALHTSKKDFRYIYAFSGFDDNHSTQLATGWIEDLDLREGAIAAGRSFGYIMG